MLNINTLRRGAIATAVCAMITGSAQAAIFDYGFTVSGEWFDNNGTPFNTLPSPYLTGTVQVDNSLLGYAAITSFSFWTEDKHWTLAQVTSGGTIFDGFGALTEFNVQFSDADGQGYVYSNNTVGVQQYATSESNYCNVCVNLDEGVPVTTPVPEPETYAMLLAGLGLLGAAARRRRRVTTA